MSQPTTPIYYAGFDPGSGEATLFLSSADGIEPGRNLLSIPSFIADGSASGLLESRSRVSGQTLAQVLRSDEYIIQYNDQDYYVGDLAIADGQNATNALGDKGRYQGLHSQVLLFALVAALIPESFIEIRLVTALPVKLYDRENRLAVKRNLEGYYRFTANGREIELVVKVGAVIMEGQGILVHHSDEISDEQAVIDIGERTVDLVAIDGAGNPRLRFCGGTELGVGQVVDELREMIRSNYGRLITTALAHKVLRAYTHNEVLPVIKVGTAVVPAEYIESTVEKAIERVGRSINTFISSTWNVEGATIGSNFDAIYIAGGGAYYFTDIIRRQLIAAQMTDCPEYANVRGYHDLSLGLESIKATIWR
jgi:Actin like proteins N terminal domain